MTFRLFVDSSNGVDIEPEYDYLERDAKIESRHRTRSGKEFVYKFGDIGKFKFSVAYVNSSFKATVNSYWKSNTNLLFMEVGATVVSSVRLTNKSLPIGSPIKPYSDTFKGVIELETY